MPAEQSAELQRKLAIIAQKREEQARAKAAEQAAQEGGLLAGASGAGMIGAASSAAGASSVPGVGHHQHHHHHRHQPHTAPQPVFSPALKSSPAPPAPKPAPPLPAKPLLNPQQLLLQKQEEYMDQLRKIIAIKEAEQKAKGMHFQCSRVAQPCIRVATIPSFCSVFPCLARDMARPGRAPGSQLILGMIVSEHLLASGAKQGPQVAVPDSSIIRPYVMPWAYYLFYVFGLATENTDLLLA